MNHEYSERSGMAKMVRRLSNRNGTANGNRTYYAMESARALDGVELVFPNVALFLGDLEGTACTPLNDPVFEDENNASHYRQIGMENAWRILKGSGVTLNKVKVGVLDTALYTGSDEFGGKVIVEGDTTSAAQMEEGEIVNAGMNHGTLVTHIIGADNENGGATGISSVLGDNLEINVKNLFKYIKSSNRWAAIFSMIIALAAVVGFYIIGEMGVEDMSNPQSLILA